MWNRPEALNPLATFLYAAAVLLAGYGMLLWVVKLPYFALREVRVNGDFTHVTKAEIEEMVKREFRGNFFTLDLEAARSAFEQLPWVRRAAARRRWPDRVEITLEEHVPLARWNAVGLVNIQGELFQASSGAPLPEFTGPHGTAPLVAAQYREARRMLAAIGRSPVRIELSERHAWRVKLDDGMTLELGREEQNARLKRFAAAYANTFSQLKHPVARVDLRYGNGFAIQVSTKRRVEG
jgi:cell division protein FtsQ